MESIKSLQLKQRQALPLDIKICMSKERVRQWYEYYDGQVYVAFSGGKDSTALLHLVRSCYPDIPAVFVDTGLEFPEIRDFVRTIDNVTWLKPKMPFTKVLEKYGYPVISKKISMGLDRWRKTKSEEQKKLRLFGGINPSSGKKQHPTISKKWHFLTKAPFKCSEKCCDVMKKEPFNRYEKKNDRKPIIGTMAEDSFIRQLAYLKNGCSAFNLKKPKSTPIAFWLEKDVWEYIVINNISYSEIYNMGYGRTGCVFCMFGIHMEKEDRFKRLEITHPKLYIYCMEKLGLKKVLDYIKNKGES